jgi:uncharacterized protein (TIGR03435 family)
MKWLSTFAIFLATAFAIQEFDVASVKPSVGSPRKGGSRNDPSLFAAHNATLYSLILRAYQIQDYQLSGGPAWAESDRYDVDARTPNAATEEQKRAMLRALLADRFHLAIHRQTKTFPVYVLTVAKGGPKFGPYFQTLKDGDPFPPDQKRLQLGGSLKDFTLSLRRNMKMFDPATGPVAPGTDIPPILDQTGLTGEYSILVSYDSHEDWAGILEHQLGLKLDLRKEPVEFVIVDHAEKPSAN